ncbi:DEAD/DEAH box helicase [Necator americanus]|uniref:DEAD/DEAH box helicase n=1 Tax=Necator americanus TaxID=51031 RepID=W2TK53_NECAM|nr:DEAD/DEAH box helicase [Necator americanus]ETN81372.1 DEAD/DEAH box helicase [Necator americanus]
MLKDCIGVSETGSGKTLGFLLPAFLHIEAQHGLYETGEKKPCPSVLVLTPTRELAQQIDREVVLTRVFLIPFFRSVCLYGGVARLDQMKVCRSGVEIVIATPGRLADLADEGVISLATVSYLVLDEADRMLDLGFEPSIRRILCEIRPDRIIALTSATWPENVRQLAKKYTKDAIMVVVGSLNLTVSADQFLS